MGSACDTRSKERVMRTFLLLLTFFLASPAFAEMTPDQQRLLLPRPKDHKMGKEDAPVTVIIYSSLSCPHCATLNQDVLPKIEKNFVETGKAMVIHRDVPFDKYGLQASLLANCVPEDQYFVYLSVLFSKQSHWTFKKNSTEVLEHIARLGGMSGEAFHTCMGDKGLQERIVAVRQEAHEQLDLRAVPTLYINGVKHEGALSEEALSDVIRRELAIEKQ